MSKHYYLTFQLQLSGVFVGYCKYGLFNVYFKTIKKTVLECKIIIKISFYNKGLNMKSSLRNTIASIALFTSATTLLVGCGNAPVDVTPPPESVVMAQVEQLAKVPEVTNFLVYWHDAENIKAAVDSKLVDAKKGSTIVEGEMRVEGLFQVYKEDGEDGRMFIISDYQKVYLAEDGSVPLNAYTNLRLEGTGEKVYAYGSNAEAMSMKSSIADYNAYIGEGNTIRPISERTSVRDQDTSVYENYAVRMNGFTSPTEYTLRISSGRISMDGLLMLAQYQGAVSDLAITLDKVTCTVNAVGKKFNVEITRDAVYGKVTSCVADGKTFEIHQSYLDENGEESIYATDMSLADVQDIFGFDIDFSDGIANFLTDYRDLGIEKNIVFVEGLISTNNPELTADVNNVVPEGELGVVKDPETPASSTPAHVPSPKIDEMEENCVSPDGGYGQRGAHW